MSSGLWKIFKRKGKDDDEAETKATKAHMGEENKMYYNEQLKRWVVRGEEHLVEQEQLPPPPPTSVGAAPPSAGPRGFARGRTSRSLYTATPGLNVRPATASASAAASLPKPAFVLPPFAASKPAVSSPPPSGETQSSSFPPPSASVEETAGQSPPLSNGFVKGAGEAETSRESAEAVSADLLKTADGAGASGELRPDEPVPKGEKPPEEHRPHPSLPVFSSSPVSACGGFADEAVSGGVVRSNISSGSENGLVNGIHPVGSPVPPRADADADWVAAPCPDTPFPPAASPPSRCEEQAEAPNGVPSMEARGRTEGVNLAGSHQGPSPSSAPALSAGPFGLSAAPATLSGPPRPASPQPAAMGQPPRPAQSLPRDLTASSAPSPSTGALGAGGSAPREDTPALHALGLPRGGLSVALDSSSEDEVETDSVTVGDESSDGSVSCRDFWHRAGGKHGTRLASRGIGGGDAADAESPRMLGRDLVRDRQQRSRGGQDREVREWERGRQPGFRESADSLQAPAYAAALKEWMDEPTYPGEDLGRMQETSRTRNGEGQPEELPSADAGVAGQGMAAQVHGHQDAVSVHQGGEVVQRSESPQEAETVPIASSLHATLPAERDGRQAGFEEAPRAIPRLDAQEAEAEGLVLHDPWSPGHFDARQGESEKLYSDSCEASSGVVPDPFSAPSVQASPSVGDARPGSHNFPVASHASVGSMARSVSPATLPVPVPESAAPQWGPVRGGALQADAPLGDCAFRVENSGPAGVTPPGSRPRVPNLRRVEGERWVEDRSPGSTHRTQVFHLADSEDAGVGALSGSPLGGRESCPGLGSPVETGEKRTGETQAAADTFPVLHGSSRIDESRQGVSGGEEDAARQQDLDAVDLFYQSDEAGGKHIQEQAVAQAQKEGFPEAYGEAQPNALSSFFVAAPFQTAGEETHRREGIIAAFSASVEDLERTSGAALEQLQEQRRARLELERRNALLQRQLHAVLVLLSRFSLSGQDRSRLARLLQPAASPKSELLLHATLNPSKHRETRDQGFEEGSDLGTPEVDDWTEEGRGGQKGGGEAEQGVGAWPNGTGEETDWLGTGKDALNDTRGHGAERSLSQHTLDDGHFSGEEDDVDFDADFVEADEVREAFNTLTQLLAGQLELQSSSRAELEVCQAEAEGYLLLVEEQQKHVIEPLCRHVERLQREQAEERSQATHLRLAQAELLRLYEGAAVVTEDLCMQMERAREEATAKGARMTGLETELQLEREKAEALRSELVARQRELESAAGDCAALRAQLESERRRWTTSQAEHAKRERELKEQRDEEIRVLLQEKEEAIRAGADQVALLHARQREKEEETLTREVETRQLREELHALQARLESVQAELASARESVRRAGEDAHRTAESLRLEVEARMQQECQRAVATLRDELAQLQAEREAARAAHASEKAQLVEAQQQAENAFTLFRHDAAKRDGAREEEIRQLREMVKTAEDAQSALHAEETKKLEQELDGAREETEKLRRETQELVGASEELRRQLEAARADQQHAAAAFEERLRRAVEGEKEAFSAERRRVEEAHAVALESLRTELTRDLQGQTAAQRSRAAELEQQLKEAERQLQRERAEKADAAKAWQEDLAQAKRRHEAREEEMKNKEAEIDVLNSVQDELQQQLAELREQCAELTSKRALEEEERRRQGEEEERRRQGEEERLRQELTNVKHQLVEEEQEKGRLTAELARLTGLFEQQGAEKKLLEDQTLALQAREREVGDLQRRLDGVSLEMERHRQEAQAQFERMLEERQCEWMRQKAVQAEEAARTAEESRRLLEAVQAQLDAKEAAHNALGQELEALRAALQEKENALASLPRKEDVESVTSRLAAQEESIALLRQQLEDKTQEFVAAEATWQAALEETESKGLACEARVREELEAAHATVVRQMEEEERRLRLVVDQEKKKAAAEEAEKLRQKFERLWDEESQKMLKAYEGVARRLEEVQYAMHAKDRELEEAKEREEDSRRQAAERAHGAEETTRELRQKLDERDAEIADLRKKANEEQSAKLAVLADQKRVCEEVGKKREALEKEVEELRGQVEEAKRRERERERQTEEAEASLRRTLQERDEEQREKDFRLQVLEERLEAERRKNASEENRRGEEIRKLEKALDAMKEAEQEKRRAEAATAELASRMEALEEEARRRQKRVEELAAELEETRRVPPTVEGVKKEALLVAKQNEELRMRTATLSTTSDFLSRRLQFFEDALDSLGPSGRAIVLEADRTVQPPEPVDTDTAAVADAALSPSLPALNLQRRGSFSAVASSSAVRVPRGGPGAESLDASTNAAVSGGHFAGPPFSLPLGNLQVSPLTVDGPGQMPAGARAPPKPPAFMQAFLPAGRGSTRAPAGTVQE
ncbi:putative plectin [Neospora caninum Liverpool]|uniref:Plectin, putative n=1 Tax=Neospora caninum (strain Liverpool) TaxID=572307 RepID=F0VD28_NEOCL|nr:putative plectin [Neospora caninum Liverpool]CBZ51543.1 putative plectin [Neospora caninum Liverpool]CEL65493.1 TPA: plectin, putative [Neospora caninum Liverpool]|eukprot:XP_003881576.1 putative plectin [Neospora caninum Liverpool]